MVVYLDIIFLENLCMNYIILYATVLLTRTKPKPVKLALGSLVGAIYAVFMAMDFFNTYSSIISKIILSILIVYIAIDISGIKNFFKTLVLFYFVSFTFGGVALALLYFIKPENIFMKEGVFVGTYPIKVVLIGGIVGYICISIVYSFIKNRFNKSFTCGLKIFIEDKVLKVPALVDSGNFLKEPITGVPVIIVESEFLRNQVPNEVLDNVEEILKGNMKNLDYDKHEYYIKNFRIIPFNSLGKENGLLLGVRVSKIEVHEDGNISTVIKYPIVGLYQKTLSKNKEYKAIIGMELLQ